MATPACIGVDAHAELAAEMALATVGLYGILRGKPRVTFRGDWTREIRKLVTQFLSTPRRAPLQDPPPFDYDEASRLLEESGTEPQVAALHALIPSAELGDDVVNLATKAILLLRGGIPRTVHQDITGTKVSRGTDMGVARFALVWAVAMDPLLPLRDLCEGTLITSETKAFETIWPNLYELAKQELLSGVVEMRTARPSWDFEPRRDRQARIFLGIDSVNADLAADFQELYAQIGQAKQEAAEAAPSANVAALDMGETLETPGQR